MGLLVVASDNRNHNGPQIFELGLGLGVKQRQRCQVDGLGRVLRVDGYRGARGGGLPHAAGADLGAADAEPRVAEQVLGVLQISLLLGAAQALAALGFGLVLVALILIGKLAGPLGLVLGDTLRLRLLVGGGLGVRLSFGLRGLLGLLALSLGVLGSVPRF